MYSGEWRVAGLNSYAGVYVTGIFVGAFAFSIGFDTGVTKFWDTWNKGVSAFWS